MSSSGSENSKLLITAIGAAVAGAALGIVGMKLYDKNDTDLDGGNPPLTDRPKRRSFIYEDIDHSDNEWRSSGTSTTLFPYNHEEKMRRRIAARAAVEEDNLTPRKSVTVRVPATSANVGPGCKL